MKTKNRKISISKTPVFLLIAALLLGVVGYYYISKRGSTTNNSYTESTTQSDVNYNPPTKDEQASGNSQKEENVKQDSGDASPNNATNVVITFAEQNGDIIEVNAYSDHYEDGTCTFSFSNGQHQLSKETPAYRDASTTICTNPLISRSEFTVSGEWQVQVTYKSPSLTGRSNTQAINIH